MSKMRVGFAMCGSFCTHKEIIQVLREMVKNYDIIPIVSEICTCTDTRFGSSENLLKELETLTGHQVICDIAGAEPIGPKAMLDILVEAPCTGNTTAKLAAGITDSAVTMAVKAHLRNGRPVVLALASNDALSAGAKNIGELLVRKGYYFVPFGQDNPDGKPTSVIADFRKLPQTVEAALEGRQIQPLLLRDA